MPYPCDVIGDGETVKSLAELTELELRHFAKIECARLLTPADLRRPYEERRSTAARTLAISLDNIPTKIDI